MMDDDEEELDLSAGMVPHPQTMPSHPAGRVTAFDQASGLPIVARHQPAESKHPETKPVDAAPKAETKPGEQETQAAKAETKPSVGEPAKPETKGKLLDTDIREKNYHGEPAVPIKADKPDNPMQKGVPVKLPNGDTGKVVFVEPNLGIVRVKTSEGKSVSARITAVKILDHVIVQEHVRRVPK